MKPDKDRKRDNGPSVRVLRVGEQVRHLLSDILARGQVYRGDRPEDQKVAATGIRRGTAGVAGGGRHWSGKAAPVGVFDAKADAFATLDALGLSPDKVQVVAEAPAWFHPGRSGTIRQGPKTVLGKSGNWERSGQS